MYNVLIKSDEEIKMRYKNVSDKEYKGFDIAIFEMQDDTYNVDVKKPCGEVVAGWGHDRSYNCALMRAVKFIDEIAA